jgi:hypothetical protein
VRKHLLEVLDQAPATPPKAKLTRARASLAR